VDLVTDAVARPREVCAVGARRRPQKSVVVRVLEVELVGLVVAVLCGDLGLDLVQVECLELQPDHGARSVLREHLVDLDADLLARFEFPLDEVVGKYLFRESSSHNAQHFGAPRE
jgi:hypothetical protein